MSRRFKKRAASPERKRLIMRVASLGSRSVSTQASNDPRRRLTQSSLAPYAIGAVAGIATLGIAGYAYYHISGAKAVVDKLMAMRARYFGAKAAAAEKSEIAREKAVVAKEAMKDRVESVRERWSARRRGGGAEE